MERRLVLILVCGSLFMLGCQREQKKTTTSITIQVPQAANKINKTGGVGALAAMPTDRKACYGVLVNGPGLPQANGNMCSPAASVRAGFVEPGSTVEISLAKGTGRTIELYAFLQSPGLNDPCPGFSASLSPGQILATYKIGSAINVDMMGDETHVTITPDFPGLGNNYAVQMNLPSSCTTASNLNGTPGFHFSNGQGVAANGVVSLSGAIGRPHTGASASNGTLVLETK